MKSGLKKILLAVCGIGIVIVLFSLFSAESVSQEKDTAIKKDISSIINDKTIPLDERVEDILNQMTQAEKVGQMVMIGVQGTQVNDDSLYMLNEYNIGGIVLFDRNMENRQQVQKLTADLQANAPEKLPLFIGIDEEGGDVVRMKNELTPPPSAKELGETNEPEQAKIWADRTAKELKDLGINLNFAPVADVGSNDRRSYSTDAQKVTEFVVNAGKGYADNNLLYCLKHFPGIGKGQVDTHLDAYSVPADSETLRSEDLVPFKSAVEQLPIDKYFIMVSHLTYSAFDENAPASLSMEITTGILRDELGYQGIIITDDLEMGAISKHYTFEEAGVKAVLAGADIVLVCHEYEHEIAVYNGILKAVRNGTISEERLNDSVRRIIKTKLMNLT